MKIVRALYEQSASALFGRVPCPTLLVPADPTTGGCWLKPAPLTGETGGTL